MFKRGTAAVCLLQVPLVNPDADADAQRLGHPAAELNEVLPTEMRSGEKSMMERLVLESELHPRGRPRIWSLAPADGEDNENKESRPS